jgi:hypothetical protein
MGGSGKGSTSWANAATGISVPKPARAVTANAETKVLFIIFSLLIQCAVGGREIKGIHTTNFFGSTTHRPIPLIRQQVQTGDT